MHCCRAWVGVCLGLKTVAEEAVVTDNSVLHADGSIAGVLHVDLRNNKEQRTNRARSVGDVIIKHGKPPVWLSLLASSLAIIAKSKQKGKGKGKKIHSVGDEFFIQKDTTRSVRNPTFAFMIFILGTQKKPQAIDRLSTYY